MIDNDGAAPGVEVPELGQEPMAARDIPLPFDTLELEPAPEPGKRRGRKPRDHKAEKARRKAEREGRTYIPDEPPAAEVSQVMSADEQAAFADALALAFRLSSQLVAAKRGAHWVMEDIESKLHGNAWAVALAPWAGQLGKWLPLATASALLVSAVASRVEQDGRKAVVKLDRSEASE